MLFLTLVAVAMRAPSPIRLDRNGRSASGSIAMELPTTAKIPPVVILPGFGNADVDYKTPFNQPEDKGLVAVLQRRGADVTVMDLPRWEWIRVAGGLFDPQFWLGNQRPDGLAYGWYLARARAAIKAASQRASGERRSARMSAPANGDRVVE